MTLMTQPFLSVVIPVYNERSTVAELLRRVAASPYSYPDLEIIAVDDGSQDGTADQLAEFADQPGVIILTHTQNRGKGAAVRTGLRVAQGHVVIIQDADLEYDPQDYPVVVEPIRNGQAIAVYGSRYLKPDQQLPWSRFRAAVVVLNWFVWALYGQRLTDEATCYKAVRRDVLNGLDLMAVRFELCPEMTAKLCRTGVRIMEVPISYRPRGRNEGKKIGWRDAWTAFATLVRWRFGRFGKEQRSDILGANRRDIANFEQSHPVDCIKGNRGATS